MPFPNFEGKHQNEAFFTPQDWLSYMRGQRLLPDYDPPAGVIFCYQSSLAGHVRRNEEITALKFSLADLWLLGSTGRRVGFCANFGIGAPVAAVLLEELVALGVKQFISIGTAGGLRPGLAIGDIVICDRAVRDEGVSHHYLPPDLYAYPSAGLTGRLQSELDRLKVVHHTGATWTIDAPYRETVAEARHYQQAGVYTVEMEAAALMAVARYRQVELATAFTISDSLAELTWNPQFRAPATNQGLVRLYEAARAALT